MTTLRRERIQKFREIIKQSEFYRECEFQWKDEYLERQLNELAEALADVAQSRTELRGIESAIFADRPVTEEDMDEKIIREACNSFESALGFGTLPWDSTSSWTELRKFVVKLYQTDPMEFHYFQAWRKDEGKYQGVTNKSIRENPAMFKDTHYPTYKAHMGMQVKPPAPVYKPQDDGEYVPAPVRK